MGKEAGASGSLVFSLANNSQAANITDIVGKRVGVGQPLSPGSFQLAWKVVFTLRCRNIHPVLISSCRFAVLLRFGLQPLHQHRPGTHFTLYLRPQTSQMSCAHNSKAKRAAPRQPMTAASANCMSETRSDPLCCHAQAGVFSPYFRRSHNAHSQRQDASRPAPAPTPSFAKVHAQEVGRARQPVFYNACERASERASVCVFVRACACVCIVAGILPERL